MKKFPRQAAPSRATRLAELAEQAAEALPQDDTLREISELVTRTVELGYVIDNLEATLSLRKRELHEITDDLIPCAMQEVGMDEFSMADGRKIKLQTVYGATIGQGKSESDEDHFWRRAKAFQWLSQNKHDGIIKSHVSLSLARGEALIAKQIINHVYETFGVTLNLKDDIHPQTLKSFVREQMQSDGNEDFPHALFRATSHIRANIKQEK